MKLAIAALIGSLSLATGCAGTFDTGGAGNTMNVKVSGGGPTIAVGAGLALLGGGLIYKVNSDDENQYGLDALGTDVGIGMIAVGAGAIIYGAYQLANETPAAPPPAPVYSAPSASRARSMPASM